MAYVTPVTDRTALDITNRTSKAFWNVADWTRVYNNSQLVNSFVAIKISEVIVFNTLTAPTITTIPTVTEFNTLIANIERTRAAFILSEGEIDGAPTEIKDDYTGGPQGDSPRYTDANLWETALDFMWDFYSGPSVPVDLVLSANLTIPDGTNYIVVDSVDMANFNIDMGTGNLCII